jgi:hypothetical protein
MPRFCSALCPAALAQCRTERAPHVCSEKELCTGWLGWHLVPSSVQGGSAVSVPQ